MLINTHRKFVLIFMVGFAILCLGVGALLYISGPRVRLVSESFDSGKDSYTFNDSIVLNFDRPIRDKDYASSISIEPRVKTAISSTNQQIIVRLLENLASDTAYKLTLRPESVQSTTGQPMKADFHHQIQTPKASYVYLKRDDKGTEDKVMLGSMSTDKEREIYVSDTIRNVLANRSHVIAVEYVEANKSDRLIIYDRKSQKKQIVETSDLDAKYSVLPANSLIKNAVLSPRGDNILFTAAPSGSTLSQFNDSLYGYNINSGDFNVFYESKKDSVRFKTYDLAISDDGQAAVAADSNLTYQVLSPYNDSLPESIGRFDKTGGFNSIGSKILFFSTNQVNYYDASQKKEINVVSDLPFFTGGFKNNSDSVYIIEHDQPLDGTEHRIVEYTENGKPNIVWRSAIKHLAKAWPSFDDRYYALEVNSRFCTYDEVEFNPDCDNSRVEIIDTRTGTKMSEKSGFNFVWLP